MPSVRTPLLLLALTLVAAACGGADDGTPSTGGATLVETDVICDRAALTSALALGSPEGTPAGMADDPVGTAASNNPVLSTLTSTVQAASLFDTLNNAQSLTIFAPTDCAFAAMDPAALQAAMADPGGLLNRTLGFHVIPGQRLAAAELTGGALETFNGQTLNYIDDGRNIILDGQAKIVLADIQTANATVHLIDRVMRADGMQDSSGTPATPSVPVDSTTICDTNGLVTAVEGGTPEGTLAGMADDPVAAAASNNPVLTTLVEAVVAASLVDALNSAEALTVFAPTDCAFAQLDPSTLQTALADPAGLLTRVLGFHVVVGQRLQFDQLTGGELATLADSPLPYTVTDNVVTLNGQAQIVVPNIQTANATVHLIDRVLLPPA